MCYESILLANELLPGTKSCYDFVGVEITVAIYCFVWAVWVAETRVCFLVVSIVFLSLYAILSNRSCDGFHLRNLWKGWQKMIYLWFVLPVLLVEFPLRIPLCLRPILALAIIERAVVHDEVLYGGDCGQREETSTGTQRVVASYT